jgi:hypothetical protein
MKKSILMACMCALALNVACSSRSNSETEISADTTELQGTIVEIEGSKKYENEYYSLTVPNDWEITESIYDRRPGLEKFTPNEMMTLSQHEVCFEGDNVLVKIVKSNYKFDKPIEFYAGLSVLSKGLMDAGEYNGVIEQITEKQPYRYTHYEQLDSMQISGREAIALLFLIVQDNEEELAQLQYVVKNDNRDVFYVNATFGSEKGYDLGDIILKSFKLK